MASSIRETAAGAEQQGQLRGLPPPRPPGLRAPPQGPRSDCFPAQRLSRAPAHRRDPPGGVKGVGGPFRGRRRGGSSRGDPSLGSGCAGSRAHSDTPPRPRGSGLEELSAEVGRLWGRRQGRGAGAGAGASGTLRSGTHSVRDPRAQLFCGKSRRLLSSRHPVSDTWARTPLR